MIQLFSNGLNIKNVRKIPKGYSRIDTGNIGGIKQSKDKKQKKSNTTHKSKKMSNMEYKIVYLPYIFNIKYMSWVMAD